MKLRALEVANFGAIESAALRFGEGLNVLHGPNDLGKSTLAASIRAALLLQHGSSGARPFVPWGTPRKPEVTLTFEIDERLWRVHKTFGSSSGGMSVLEWSNDGHDFSTREEGRAVDGELRRLLGWGLAEPGGRGGSHGFPKSFLSTVLLGEQALPYRVLGQGLDTDAEDSGKARLVEALQAMATDPLYQHVLDAAQQRVDEAFTATGKRSGRKGSPFERASTEIRARREASESLAQQVVQSESVISRLAEVNQARDQKLAVQADAAQRHAELLEARKLGEQRAVLQAEVDDAQRALDAIEDNRQAIAALDEELRAARDALPEVDARVEAAANEHAGARAALQRERADLEALARGDDPKAQREAAEHREAIRIHEVEAQALERARQALVVEAGKRDAQAKAHEALNAARTQAEEIGAANTAAQAAVERARTAHQGLLDAQRWARMTALDERVAKQREAREQAEAKRAQAHALLEPLGADFPSEQERAAMRKAWDELRMREAALGGGLRASWKGEHAVSVHVDGERGRDLREGEPLDAQREITVHVEGVGALHVIAGNPEEHEALEQARASWKPHAQTLAALELESIDAVQTEARRRQSVRTEADGLRREADLLTEHAQGEDLTSSLEAARRAVEGVDSQACRALIDTHGDALATEVDDAAAALAAAQRREGEARDRAAHVQTELRVAEQAHEAATQDLETFMSSRDTSLGGVEEIERRVEEVHAALAQARASLEELAAGQQTRQALAHERVAAAEAALEGAQSTESQAREAQAQANASITTATAQLSLRREQASGHNPMLAAERIARAQDALEGHPEVPVVDDDALEAAENALAAANEALEDAERAVRQQEGALQHVGGQVVRERAQMAREALEDAQRSEAEVALDYDGWRVLLSTLREVENETGAHLGRALGGTISERINALSQGRYAGASLDADLQARGVLTRHGEQDIGRLSEGVKEQFATVLRVAVAEQLGTMLLLDDHLAQTDPERARWFRDALRRSAEQIQIVVLTCRPGDYLDQADGVHEIDLRNVVQRRS